MSGTNSKKLHVLVLQGGGALGSYQAGIVEVLSESETSLDWVAGVSIGAINAALIAGNPPERRVERLREFWGIVTSTGGIGPWWGTDGGHALINAANATWVTIAGAPGFFSHHFPPRALYPAGAPGPISYYDTAPLRETLLRLVDFDLINSRQTRLSVGAVDVETGNNIYFDNTELTIRPEHIMASGALPPGFPTVEIDGRHYWDGGLVSNTPLQHVLDNAEDDDMIVLQVDLFPARGRFPKTLDEASSREKDIRYSSRTRLNTDQQVHLHRVKESIRRLIKKLPAELRQDPDALFLADRSREPSITIYQMIFRNRSYEGSSKDYEFSRSTMLEHWAAGAADARRSIQLDEWVDRRKRGPGIKVFDLTLPKGQTSGKKG